MKTAPTSQINFTSKIKVVSLDKFLAKTYFFSEENCVDSPWGVNEIKRAQKAKTNGVRSCTAGGIVTKNQQNKREVIMFHLAPEDENLLNINFESIQQTLLKKLGNDQPIQGLLVGSKSSSPYSTVMFAQLEDFFKKLNIPYSKLEGLPERSKAHLAYFGRKDTWLVYVKDRVDKLNNKKPILNFFEDSYIHPMDKIVAKHPLVSRLKQLLFH